MLSVHCKLHSSHAVLVSCNPPVHAKSVCSSLAAAEFVTGLNILEHIDHTAYPALLLFPGKVKF